ncbi:MAG: B12-binding domain-containing radical SAM protein [Candidatus Binatia bacterium]
MKVSLLNPPSFAGGRLSRGLMGGYGLRVGDALVYPPLQLAYVAAALERSRHRVDIIDAEAKGHGSEQSIRSLESSAPDFVGMSFSKDAFEDEVDLAREIRARLGRPVCALGPMATTHTRELLASGSADFVILGEPDLAFTRLVDALEANSGFPIAGLAYRSNGEIEETPGQNQVADLDELPFPARHLLDNSLYRFPRVTGPVTTIQSSRGCPVGCPFCPYVFTEGSQLRERSPRSVVEEMQRTHRDLGITQFVFRDPIFTLRKARVEEICRLLIERRLPIRWLCETALGFLSEPLLAQMKQAGCIAVSFGIESANELLQKKYAKNKIGSLEHALAIVEACSRIGLETRAFFMLGFPGETRAMMDETIDFAVRLDPTTVQFLPVTLYEGTPLHEAPDSNDLVSADTQSAIRSAYRRFYGRPSRLVSELKNPAAFVRKSIRVLSSLR